MTRCWKRSTQRHVLAHPHAMCVLLLLLLTPG
jgi:hypothetical protein